MVGIQENGNGRGGGMELLSLSDVPDLGTNKNKYKRMDSDFDDDFNDALAHHQQTEERRKTTRKFVFACAVFASLNNVLLGYGMLFNFSFFFIFAKN